MILLQLSSAQGPEECCLAVSKALHRLNKEADAAQVRLECLEQEVRSKPRHATLSAGLSPR